VKLKYWLQILCSSDLLLKSTLAFGYLRILYVIISLFLYVGITTKIDLPFSVVTSLSDVMQMKQACRCVHTKTELCRGCALCTLNSQVAGSNLLVSRVKSRDKKHFCYTTVLQLSVCVIEIISVSQRQNLSLLLYKTIAMRDFAVEILIC
jgi:hypothetical protein